MLIRKEAKCIKCGKEYFVASPYGTYNCNLCGRFIGHICNDCLPYVKCSCGGTPVDETAEFAAEQGMLF